MPIHYGIYNVLYGNDPQSTRHALYNVLRPNAYNMRLNIIYFHCGLRKYTKLEMLLRIANEVHLLYGTEFYNV